MTTLHDGVRVTLRPIAPDDRGRLLAGFERLSEESRYRRFFASKTKLSEAELDYFVDVEHKDHEAIIAIEPSSGEMLGVARYIRSSDDLEVAEVAMTVVDDWQGRGLGRALTDDLAARARREGVRRFSATVLSENRRALALFDDVGYRRCRSDGREIDFIGELIPVMQRHSAPQYRQRKLRRPQSPPRSQGATSNSRCARISCLGRRPR